MVRLWKHIHRLHTGDLIFLIQQSNVPGLGSRITTDVYNFFRSYFQEHIYNILMHAGRHLDLVRLALSSVIRKGGNLIPVEVVDHRIIDENPFASRVP